MEGQRRARELGHQREAHIAMSVARYESVMLQALNNIAELDAQIATERAALKSDSPGRPGIQAINAAERAIIGHERVIIQAVSRIDELFGLTFRPARS